MNINRSSLFWGLLLIGGGVLALTEQFGYIDNSSPTLWIFVFAVISLLGFVSYAMSGWTQWGWLFPAGIFGGLAITITLAENNIDNAVVASPLFLGLALPFAAAFFTDRTRNWWALIPGGVMLTLALILAVDTVGGEWIGALFLLLFGLSFLLVYLNNRTRTWALLVAYIFGVLSVGPMLSALGDDAGYFGAIFLLAVALPFYLVYFRASDQNWWAIIPAGVMTTLAILVVLSIAGLLNDNVGGAYGTAFLMAGLAATFAVLWFRHGKTWAKTVAIILALLAVVSLFFISYFEMFWPIAIILAGIYLFYTALRRPKVVQ